MTGVGWLLYQKDNIQVLEFKASGWFKKPQYAWRYVDAASVFGPFDTLAGCEFHCKTCLAATQKNPSLAEEKSNVIQVNFKTRKRIS